MQYEELEQDIGGQLHALPEVKPDPDFEANLKHRLEMEQQTKNEAGKGTRRALWMRSGMIACLYAANINTITILF